MLQANVDPLKRFEKPSIPELDPASYGLTEADMEVTFNTGSMVGPEQMPLREIVRALRETYCGSIGAEFCTSPIRHRAAGSSSGSRAIRAQPSYSADFKRFILERLTAAETLEKYLHTRYVGQKRFSLEGGDSLIPLLDYLLQRAGEQGVQEIVIGMAHRGRLNVLVNTMGKMPKDLFSEFEGKHVDHCRAGDVKYHMGFSSDIITPGGPMHLSLAFNPSHLEIVNPVVEGSVRARQHRRKDREGKQVLAGADPRRRRVRRPGRRDGNAEPVADARLPYRRHGARHRQQPDRLHHLGYARRPLDPVLHRRGRR